MLNEKHFSNLLENFILAKYDSRMLYFLLDASQPIVSNHDLISSVIKIALFLITLGLGGYMFIKFKKYGFYNASSTTSKPLSHKINIIDTKILGNGKYLSAIEYENKKVLVAISKDGVTLLCEINKHDYDQLN